jgi:hypothetical protein
MPCGLAYSSGVSWVSGAATRSRRTPRCVAASRLNSSEIALKMAKSVRICHGGAIAGSNECTNGCMSVVLRSCFSYQVAAGSTTSEYTVVPVIRKSRLTSRSSLPVGACSCQTTSFGRAAGGASVARSDESVPSRCLRKYSLPFEDDPSRFARQIVSTRGKFSGASGSSPAKRSSPDRSRSTTYSPGLCPEAAISSARSRGLRLNVGCEGIQPIRADWASTSAAVVPANRPEPSGVASPSMVVWS